jgi:hypothetical protein
MTAQTKRQTEKRLTRVHHVDALLEVLVGFDAFDESVLRDH